MAATGLSRSPKLLKGALVEFSERFIGPIPNVIVFQYNPETLTRRLTVWEPPAAGGSGEGGEQEAASATAATQPRDPPETFDLELYLDATDRLEEGNPVAQLTGIADQIAALELLLYPPDENLFADLVGAVAGAVGASVSVSGSSISFGGAAAGGATPVPQRLVPIVLLVWGPGRIVPVRLTSFQVEEQAFSPTLYPLRAKVSVGIKIMTPTDLAPYTGLAKELAVGAFNFTRTQKRVLAAANLANSVDSILSMLPS